MAQYSDGEAGDVNPNEDNYWLFATNKTIRIDSNGDLTTDLNGFEFDPYETYTTNVALRDGTGTAEDGQGDNFIESKADGRFHDNDGVRIGRYEYHYSNNWVFDAIIEYEGTNADGSPVTMPTRVYVSRLEGDDDDNPDSPAPLNGKAVIRFIDNQIPAIYNGPDGAGGRQYPLISIKKVTLGSQVNQTSRISIESIYDDPFPSIMCFAHGTLIESEAGQVPVEELRAGDLVQTADNGAQPIRWIGSRYLSKDEVKQHPKLKPIRIRAGALSSGCPSADLIVSPQHRVLISAQWARELFGSDEVMVPAKKLVSLPGIEIADDMEDVTYFHVLLENHELLSSNGALTESLYLGPQTLESLSPESMEEVTALFPELVNGDEEMTPVRHFVQRNGDVQSLLGGI